MIEAIEAGRMLVPGETSSMLGVLVDGRPVGSYICGVASLATYTRAPYGTKVLRVTSDGVEIDMGKLPKPRSLRVGTLLQHGRRQVTNPLTSRLMGVAFGQVLREASSIGLSTMRVFNGELVAMLRVAGGFFTPWDDTPTFATCGQGDVAVLRVGSDHLVEIRAGTLEHITPQDFDVLYVPRRYLPELRRQVPVVTLS